MWLSAEKTSSTRTRGLERALKNSINLTPVFTFLFLSLKCFRQGDRALFLNLVDLTHVCVRKTAQQRPFGKWPKQLGLSCRQKRPEAMKNRAVMSTLGHGGDFGRIREKRVWLHRRICLSDSSSVTFKNACVRALLVECGLADGRLV